MTDKKTQTRLGFSPERLAAIRPWMQSYVDAGKYPGCSLLVARDGEIAYRTEVGHRDIENDKPFAPDTIARIYSMTKPVTSLAIAMLMEEGRFTLTTPVSAFIPEFKDSRAIRSGATNVEDTEPARSPTILELLVHTSGLTYSFNEGMLPQAYARNNVHFGTGPVEPGLTLEMAAKRAATMPLAFQPGTRWEYSIGIDILGRVVEVVSGMTLDRFFEERIFAPLGMKDTAFDVPDDRLDRFAACYFKPESGDKLMVLQDPVETSRYRRGQVSSFSGGGGLVSTLDDYFRFADMLRLGGTVNGHRFIGRETLQFMRRNFLRGDIASMGPTSFAEMPMEGTGFGLGWSVMLDPALAKVPGHVGDYGWGGYASTVWWNDPSIDMTVIYFTQLIPSASWPSRPQLKAMVMAALD